MQGGSAQCSGSGGGAHPNADPDWRLYLPPDARQMIVNKIMETLKRHLPVPVPDELSELQRNAVQFEEKIYSVAISKPDYLRKISLRMLSMETKSPPVSNPALPNQEGRSQLGFINPDFTAMQGGSAMCSGSGSGSVSGSGAGADLNANLDWRFQLQRDARLRIVNKIMDTLKRHLPVSVPDGLSELKEMAVRFEEKIYNAAISQPDYLRKVSLKMLSIETKTQPVLNPALPNREGVGMMPPQSGPYLGHSLATPQSMNQPSISRQQQRQQPLTQGLPSTSSSVGGGPSGATIPLMSGPSISNNNPMSVPGGMQQQPVGQGGLIQQQQPQPTMQNPTIPNEQMNNVTDLQQQCLQLQQNQMQQNQLQTHEMQFEERIFSATSSQAFYKKQDARKRMPCRKNIVEKSRKCRICGDCSHKRRSPY